MKSADINVAVNFNTGYVIEKDGIEIDGVVYHTQYDLPGGKGQTIYTQNTFYKKETTVSKSPAGARITVNWIAFIDDTTVQIRDFEYQKEGDGSNWTTIDKNHTVDGNVRSLYFDVSESGIYYVRAKNIDGDNTARVSVTIINEPSRTDLTYVYWNSKENDWIEITDKNTLAQYYDYSTAQKKWINAKDSNGNWWVWIPRFAYKIVRTEEVTTGTGEKTNVEAKRIDIKFLNGSSSLAPNEYVLHPAFDNNRAGFWISKYQISEGNKSVPCEEVFLKQANEITMPNSSHLVTPLEYGALLYLTYGSDQTIVGVNKLGIAGGSNNETDVYLKNTNMSSTKNCTGVYDLSSVNGDLVAGKIGTGSEQIGGSTVKLYNANGTTVQAGDSIDDIGGGDGKTETFIRNYNLISRPDVLESGKYLVFGRNTSLTYNMFNLNYDTEGSYRAVLN